jgi:hypothetical protein
VFLDLTGARIVNETESDDAEGDNKTDAKKESKKS